MNIHKSTLVVLVALSLASTNVLSQSRASSQVGKATPSPRVLLGLGTNHQATQAAATHSVSDPVALGLASAHVYHFASADFPGAAGSLVFDRNSSTVLGDSAFTNLFGFTLHNGAYQAINIPGSNGTSEATGINTTGEIVGVYGDAVVAGQTHGFLDNGGTITTLDFAGGGSIEPIDINDSGEIVGAYIDPTNVSHGFYTLDSGASYTIFDVPGATSTQAAGVNTSGAISGLWTDSSSKEHGFLFSGGTFTTFDFPTATATVGIGINDSNEIAGYYTDAANLNHGFIYSAGVFTKVDVAGATQTQLTRIKNLGQITGDYTDSSSELHGLTGH